MWFSCVAFMHILFTVFGLWWSCGYSGCENIFKNIYENSSKTFSKNISKHISGYIFGKHIPEKVSKLNFQKYIQKGTTIAAKDCGPLQELEKAVGPQCILSVVNIQVYYILE